MRPLRLTFLGAVAILTLAACGGSGETTAPATTTSSESDESPAETEPALTETPADESSATTPETNPPVTEPEPATTDATTPTSDPTAPVADPAAPAGTAYVDSLQPFDATVASAVAAIEGNPALRLVANINHAGNAANAGLELAPTTELIFGNPNLGTPFMQAVPGIGLDLPQKMLIVEGDDGNVRASVNHSSYLAQRHGVSGFDEAFAKVDGALAGLLRTAGGLPDDAAVIVASAAGIETGRGIVETTTTGTARDAADRLIAAVEANPNLILVGQIDHAANAASVDLELSPLIEVIFGNPALGTPLMQAEQSIGMDLPQKMLFVETGDGVTVTYNDPGYLAQRHNIDPATPQLATVAGALGNLAAAAAG